MLWLAVIIAVVAIIYIIGRSQKSPPGERLQDLEREIENLKPFVTNYLENCRDRITERLNNFKETSNRLRIVTREDMQKALDYYENDLALVEKYIELSDKFKDNLTKRIQIATAYYNFLSLIDSWRKDNLNLGTNILDKDGNPSYGVITKLQEIRDYFNSLSTSSDK